jgi:pimeloyl-ACP methyl ester carboxylesterase
MGVMPASRLALVPVLFSLGAALAAPPSRPANRTVVIGFLGGFEHWNDEHRGVRRVALDLRARGDLDVVAETFGNHHRPAAMMFLRRLLDTNGDGKLDATERASARVVLYGQSWGGAAAVKAARELESWGVPVLLTVQVDSVGLSDAVIPPNVRSAANFFQHDPFTIHGRQEIRAADPARTEILGNYELTYFFRSIDAPPGSASWARRNLAGSHAKMELDPAVWAQVEGLILNAITRK